MCCRYIELPLARPLSLDEEYWVSLHPGVSLKHMGRTVRIEITCSALTEDGYCSLYGLETRPAMCEAWPDKPEEQAPEGCAYLIPELTLNTSGGGGGVMPR